MASGPDCKGNPRRRSYCRATRLGFVRIYPSELISLLTSLSNLSWNLPLFTHVSLGFQSFYGSLITTSAYLLAVRSQRWISLSFSLSRAMPSKILTIRFFIGLLFFPSSSSSSLLSFFSPFSRLSFLPISLLERSNNGFGHIHDSKHGISSKREIRG